MAKINHGACDEILLIFIAILLVFLLVLSAGICLISFILYRCKKIERKARNIISIGFTLTTLILFVGLTAPAFVDIVTDSYDLIEIVRLETDVSISNAGGVSSSMDTYVAYDVEGNAYNCRPTGNDFKCLSNEDLPVKIVYARNSQFVIAVVDIAQE